MPPTIERKTCPAPDGVTLVYSAAGTGEPGLVFIHGGLANRSFWDAQFVHFASRHRVVAPDLPGHGESGANRRTWGLPAFGADVCAVVEAERFRKVILFGNSLGGPVAIEAALLLHDRAIGVVGVDTFHRLDYTITADEARQRAEAFRDDYAASLKEMVTMLFHPDADPAVRGDAERRMECASRDFVYPMFMSMAGYDVSASARRLDVPLRAINGDLYPTDTAAVRSVYADFDAVVMTHMGHYPMLERPAEFNRLVAGIVDALSGPA